MSAPLPVVSVVVGTYDRLRFLRATVESVRDELARLPHELIIVDGGSTDGTRRWLVEQKDVITIVQHNRGDWRGRSLPRRSWGYFMNLGFRAASAEALCMLSDDCLVVPGAIRNGLTLLDERRGRGERTGGVAFYWRNWPVDEAYRVGLTWGDRLFVNHGLYTRDALQAVGYAEVDTYSFYHADGDLSERMWEAGWPTIESPNSFVEHYADANIPLRRANFARQQADWRTYCDRWAHLGTPHADWCFRAHVDATDSVHRHWGRVVTHPVYRRAMQASGLARILYGRLRERLSAASA